MGSLLAAVAADYTRRSRPIGTLAGLRQFSSQPSIT
jgi:hypothetical protein